MEEKTHDIAQFTWLESYTNAVETLPSSTDKALLTLAIMEYGAIGKEPKFVDTKTFPAIAFKAVFEGLRWSIDEGRNRSLAGRGGKGWGKPRKGESEGDYYSRKFEEFRNAGDTANAQKAYDKALECGTCPEDALDASQVPDEVLDYMADSMASAQAVAEQQAWDRAWAEVDISQDLACA